MKTCYSGLLSLHCSQMSISAIDRDHFNLHPTSRIEEFFQVVQRLVDPR